METTYPPCLDSLLYHCYLMSADYIEEDEQCSKMQYDLDSLSHQREELELRVKELRDQNSNLSSYLRIIESFSQKWPPYHLSVNLIDESFLKFVLKNFDNILDEVKANLLLSILRMNSLKIQSLHQFLVFFVERCLESPNSMLHILASELFQILNPEDFLLVTLFPILSMISTHFSMIYRISLLWILRHINPVRTIHSPLSL